MQSHRVLVSGRQSMILFLEREEGIFRLFFRPKCLIISVPNTPIEINGVDLEEVT